VLLLAAPCLQAESLVLSPQQEAFRQAWDAARSGDRSAFEQALPGLEDYLLYPYLRYEDLRHRRARVPAEEMAGFIEAHRDWAFTPALETAWLRSLGKRGRWAALLEYGSESRDTEVRCNVAHARIRTGDTGGLLPVAQGLWAAGQSQPDACDPVFAWLKQQDGIGNGLAWERVRLAMKARERKLARYAGRFMDEDQQVWAERWYQQDRGGYRQLSRALGWPDNAYTREIADFGLRRLARSDPDRAWQAFTDLDQHIGWPEDTLAALRAELALWSAVDRSPQTADRMAAVPPAFRDDRLLEWHIRYQLTQGDWEGVLASYAGLSSNLQDDTRWRYWEARALIASGRDEEGRRRMAALSTRATFYGFLAADFLERPYSLCPETPEVPEEVVAAFLARDRVSRALELHRVGLLNWGRNEWTAALVGADRETLRAAAAVAVAEDWPDRAITALGDSGDRRWYEWRFPSPHIELVRENAAANGLDPAWVMGLMRSESALAEDAISHAGARGLMQITPGTASRLARKHGFAYRGRAELLEPQVNVRFGTTYLRDLLERFDGNHVLATGAYNAGPGAVDRWIDDGYTGDAAVWIDSLPYFETRDYIPRVLAFTTIYEWRLGLPVRRVSTRMPDVGVSGAVAPVTLAGTVDVACTAGE
jgi:soluble lytic murein transglycosylase